MGCSKGWSSADLFLSIQWCVLCNDVHLTNDLAVVHLQRRLDHDPAAVQVLARLPERHSILADDLFLDAVRGLLVEGHSQMLSYLRLSAKLEGQGAWGLGVDDAQIRLLGVEVEDEVRLAALDGLAQGPKVQASVSLALCHF